MTNKNESGAVVLTFEDGKVVIKLTVNKKVTVTKNGTILIKEPKK
jgi:hypothetical protein